MEHLASQQRMVTSQQSTKIVQLEKYLAGQEKEHYQNIKAMIDYEVMH